MITLDHDIRRDSDLDSVVWREVSLIVLQYNCFLGGIRFVVDDVDMSADWGWVPVFDFAYAMTGIAERLMSSDREVFEFTDSSLTISFTRRDRALLIDAEYVPEVATTTLEEFADAAEALLRDVRADIEKRQPDLRRNTRYRNAAERPRGGMR